MQMEDTLKRIHTCGVVAVVRGIGAEALTRTLDALFAAGVDCVEIAMSVHGALKDISRLKEHWADQMIIGAGEVLNGEMATLADAAQADFCSGIGASPNMVRASIEHDLLPIPGALTPTEIQVAWHAGASIVKLFPAEMLNAEYVSTVRRVLPRVEVMPSGGISADNAAAFVRAGAFAVGAGRNVVDPALVEAGHFDEVTRRAREIRQAVLAARE
ncbi:MAG: bifunctional 4-hydroxy-2-oxoglutarate aldolase/2-dehydro-3-deoxy-phosphogluconate aldolase [Armatimonadetes bacterium]|nr:bifunctional 4-hydroxy-2-oxoglutarate aldolase/2-dehydro-3-deoxy-phosphogluconate aldolase [Armatimonadota bacterium]